MRKQAATATPRSYGHRARPRLYDKDVRERAHPSRHIPREVKRAVWQRDGGQCAFVAPGAQRCTERTFLEYHHVQPYAIRGPATVANITLRCRRHNQYEAGDIFGPYCASIVREGVAYRDSHQAGRTTRLASQPTVNVTTAPTA